MDLLASEYGWTDEYIESKTLSKIMSLKDAISRRKEIEYYEKKVLIWDEIKANIVMSDRKEHSKDDVIGTPPWVKSCKLENTKKNTVDVWKEDANKRGLKISS